MESREKIRIWNGEYSFGSGEQEVFRELETDMEDGLGFASRHLKLPFLLLRLSPSSPSPPPAFVC